MELGGMHHVTAVTGQAARNLLFYTRTLGMRLVKRTVNQDDVSAYHLFYGDRVGHTGTDITFFDWPLSAESQYGPGTVARTSLRVTGQDALEWWLNYFTRTGVVHDGMIDENGRATIAFRDPEGQRLALVNDGGAGEGTAATHAEVPQPFGIRGLGPPMISASQLEPTAHMLRDILNFRVGPTYSIAGANGKETRDVHVFETGAGGASAEVHVVVEPGIPRGRVGRGGVHHIAFRTPNDEEQRAWRDRLLAAHVNVTPVIDRFYFHSLYFREPGGVLFEIATDGPGFSVDEPIAELGAHLSLPPFLEKQRDQIVAQLAPLPG